MAEEYLGSLGGGNLFDSEDDDESAGLVDQLLADSPAPGPAPKVAEPDAIPTNQATMICLRGPCVHYWSLISRFPSALDRITIAKAAQCNCYVGEEVRLNDANVFSCDQWWPRWLSFVPTSMRALLRPRLKAAWDKHLKRKDPDAFAWKWWADDHFERATGAVPDVLRKASKAITVAHAPESVVSGGVTPDLPEDPGDAPQGGTTE